MIAVVERRSCTNRGSVGTSKDSRSALPVQFRKGSERAFNSSASLRAAASSSLALARSALETPFGPFEAMIEASLAMRSSSEAIRASARSRAAFRPSQSRAGDSEES